MAVKLLNESEADIHVQALGLVGVAKLYPGNYFGSSRYTTEMNSTQ